MNRVFFYAKLIKVIILSLREPFTCTRRVYSITCLRRLLKKKTKECFSKPIIAKCRSKVLQNAPREHSAILWTFIKLPFVIRIFVLSNFEWPFKVAV